MKRTISTSLLLLCCFFFQAVAGEHDGSAAAEKKEAAATAKKEESAADSTKIQIRWFYGGKIAFDTYKYNYSIAGNSYSQRTNTFGISPKFGVFLNEKMLVGLALWYNTQVEGVPAFALTIKELEEYLKQVKDPKTVSNSFSIAPHFRYRCFAFWEKRIGLWAEFRPFFTIQWVNASIFTNTVRVYEYGFRLGPVITIDITPKFIFETSFDILAIGWQGSTFNQTLEYDYNNVHHSLPVSYNDSNFGFSYGFNANTLFNAIVSVGIIKRF